MPPIPSAAASAPVSTARTPGAESAAVMSTRYDPRVRMRRQHRHAIALARQNHIADERARAGEKSAVLDAPHGLADAELAHVRSSRIAVFRRCWLTRA